MALINALTAVAYVLLIIIYGQRNNELHHRIRKLKKILKLKPDRHKKIIPKIEVLESESRKLTRQASTVILVIPIVQISAPEFSRLYIGDNYWVTIGMFLIFGLLLQGIFYTKGEQVLVGFDTEGPADFFY